MRASEFLSKHDLLADSEFLEKIRVPIKINRKYNVPYLAGSSKDRKTIYFDKHLPKIIDDIEVTKYIVLHEKVEAAVIDLYDLSYKDAHKIANIEERKAVEADGIDWSHYSKILEPYMKKIDKETLKDAPSDLDLTPYLDEKDINKLIKGRT